MVLADSSKPFVYSVWLRAIAIEMRLVSLLAKQDGAANNRILLVSEQDSIATNETMVYLIGYRQGGMWHVKIGIAVNPAQRLKQLQTGNSHSLSILKAIGCVSPRQVERRLHQQFRHYRQSGEWFKLNDSTLQHLEQVMDRVAMGQCCSSVL